MIDADADMAAILAAGDFAEEVTVAGQTIMADFTNATDSVNLMDGRVEAHAPTLMCKTADVAGVAREAVVVRQGVTYKVERNERVGMGLNVLYLKT